MRRSPMLEKMRGLFTAFTATVVLGATALACSGAADRVNGPTEFIPADIASCGGRRRCSP